MQPIESVSAAEGRVLPTEAITWLSTESGRLVLRVRAKEAAQAFMEPGLGARLGAERAAMSAGGSKVFRIGNSLRKLTEEMALLALADAQGETGPESVSAWGVIEREFLPALLSLDEVNFQGRTHTPPWHADLWTADIGVNLAWAVRFAGPLQAQAPELSAWIRVKCLAPILADWLDEPTRWHSLDSMGHNWWAVIVASAGIMAALERDEPTAARVAERLLEWFHFPGREFSRKQPNFGREGDYVEGLHYCEYALAGVVAFAHLRPAFRWVPEGLDETQAHGLAAWFRRSYLHTPAGWRIQRFGDTPPRGQVRAEVWHALARATDDEALLALAHAIKPAPRSVAEFILWQPGSSPCTAPDVENSLRVFPTSGLAFERGAALAVTTRAGECWAHNHLDAGTFIFQQEGLVWIDDAGSCAYSHPDYLDYYVTPTAHNVACARALVPLPRRAVYSGLPTTGRYLSAARSDDISIWCVDTGVLSGGALARSYRWYIRLGEAGLVVWDDLEARQPQEFESRLHTAGEVERSAAGEPVALRQGGSICALAFFSDAATEFAAEPVVRGEPELRHLVPDACGLTWRTTAVERVKFGLALGTRLSFIAWGGSAEAGGWRCALGAKDGARWEIWFNPLADGRVMHQNCVGRWNGLTTDAYALIVHEDASGRSFAAIEASFVRHESRTLYSSLSRKTDAVLQTL